MKIHYMNCGSMYPRGAMFFVPHMDRSPSLCMLIEAGKRLILVDTGFGAGDMANPNRLGRAYNFLMNVRREPEMTAIRQVERLGFKSSDVCDIICTHLDPDHTGGLADFPHANIHVSQAEYDSFMKIGGAHERTRHCKCHFTHGPRLVPHGTISKNKWFGMDCMRDLSGLPKEIVLVPLEGHTRGQVGVAVDTGNIWVLHCGDAYYIKEELRLKGKAPLGVRGFRRIAHEYSFASAMHYIEELKRIMRDHGDEVRLLSSHDQFEYRAITGRPLD